MITQQAKTQSLDSEYKVFIIDECHSISNTGWQAFLKLIEEPPAKSIFIFCTTDPQKIPKTILSRVQRYDFQRISHAGVVSRLAYILTEENSVSPNWEQEAIDYIAKIADGGMRDAITLMDKCLAYSPDLTIENVLKALGTVDYDTMFFLTDSIITNDIEPTIKVIEDVHRAGKDLKQFIKTYTNFVLDLCKYGVLRSFDLINIPSTYADKMGKYNDHAYEDFNRLLSTLVKLNADIKWETSPKPVIESVLLLRCMERD
jgi:DNA polymerase-3 subunit gamma/tau